MSTEIKSIVREEMIRYAQNDEATVKDRDKLVDTIFAKLDTNSDGKLSDKDKINSDWKELFGIDSSVSLTKRALASKLDDVLVEMSIKEAEGDVIENDYSESYISPEMQAEINQNAKDTGAELFDLIDGYTANYKYSIVNEILEGVNKDNVLDILEGYYSKRSSANPEGIIEALDDEYDGGAITMENKKNLINSMLELAEENGLGNSVDCRIIRAILKMYDEGGTQETAKTFNHNHQYTIAGVVEGAAAGATAGAVVGGGIFSWATAAIGAVGGALGCFVDGKTDNEELDEAINNLRAKLKTKLNR